MTKILRETYVQIALLILSVGAFFGFGLHHLTQFVTADEHYWVYERIPQYWEAWKEQKWKNTFINDKPGVTLAIIDSISLLAYPDPQEHQIYNKRRLDIYHADQTEALYRAFRLPILILNTLFLIYLFWVVSKLTANRWIALWTTMGTALSPILIGISQIVNPDALLWTFSTGAFFTYLAVLQFPKERKFVWLTAIFLGLAILSKYTATILYPIFAALLIGYTFSKQSSSTAWYSLIRQQLGAYVFVVIGSITTILILMPAAAARIKNFYELMAGFSSLMPWIYGIIFLVLSFIFFDTTEKHRKAVPVIQRFIPTLLVLLLPIFSVISLIVFTTLIIGHRFRPDWRLFESIPFDIKESQYFDLYNYAPNFFEHLLLNVNPLVFSLPPILLLLLFVAWIGSLRIDKKSGFSFASLAVILFFWLFFVANILAGVVTSIRYAVMLYPLAAFMAAFGLWEFSQRFKRHPLTFPILSLLFFAALSGSVWSSSPFYFNYTNALLPKDKIITDSWGYGGYETAQFINAQPDTDEIVVWSDYFGVCEFIKGKCITDYKYEPGEYQVDYYVTTRRGKLRYQPEHERWRKVTTIEPYKYYDRTDPVWQLEIDDRPENFIRVYEVPKTGCESNNELCASIITDIGACQTDPGNYRFLGPLLSKFVSSASAAMASFTISLGDNVNYGLRQCSSSGQSDLQWVKQRLAGTTPTLFALGDHDIESENNSDQFWRKLTGRDQTYFSFDRKDVHVIVLDTVLGGDRLRPRCEEDEVCSSYQKQLSLYNQLLKDSEKLKVYLKENNLTKNDIIRRKAESEKLLSQEQQIIKETRSADRRDRGRIGNAQLEWLARDLQTASKEKILIFSDHPLFRFQSQRKLYDIVGRQVVQDILEKSGKHVVAISGEAHLWHETEQNDIHYYIVDQFANNGAWAFFRWNQDGFTLTKMQGDQPAE